MLYSERWGGKKAYEGGAGHESVKCKYIHTGWGGVAQSSFYIRVVMSIPSNISLDF